jgi:hypothetical protein
VFVGIESYREGLDPIKSFMGWEKELPHYIRKLRSQHAHYAQTIEILFGPIATELEFASMISDPGASQELWKSKETALQDRLGRTYTSYQSTMGEIERITKKIASRLDLNRAAEVGMFPTSLEVGYKLCSARDLRGNLIEGVVVRWIVLSSCKDIRGLVAFC